MVVPLFTLDYELHGNGDGDPQTLMIDPTHRMLDQFDRFGARLTIMADVAEILRFREIYHQTGKDSYKYQQIEKQLRDAVARGHDVQLHLHTSWFGARFEKGKWIQNWNEYSFADLPFDKITKYLKIGKDWLDEIIQPVKSDYRCNVFRAANWSMQPSADAIRSLISLGFKADTSVFKWGRRKGLVNFDYSDCPHPLIPWRAAPDDICSMNEQGELWEIPIYSEKRTILAFISLNRIYRACLSRRHRLPFIAGGKADARDTTREALGRLRWLFDKHAWKADFNQCSGSQLVAALKRAERLLPQGINDPDRYPFVMIGHSKLYTHDNERSLEKFLSYIKCNPSRYSFGCFSNTFPLARDVVEPGQFRT